MQKILIVHTGGTIAMTVDENNISKPTAENPLMKLNDSLSNEDVKVTSESFCNLPSPSITPTIMLHLAQRIQKAEGEGYDGVVVTHGTDTLEETAYFLDLVLDNNIPVAVTGAMRAANAIGADGVHNIQDAILAVSAPAARGKGVMVVLNDKIDAARTVVKTNTTNVATFKSPLTGPLGIISNGKATFIEGLEKHIPAIHLDHLVDHIYVLTSYSGMSTTLFDAVDNDQTNGVVIEGLGAGNLPPTTLPGVERLLAHHIPVVLVSRCVSGFAEPIYGCVAGGATLKQKGVIICQGLNGDKARIKLIVGLSAGKKGQELVDFMSNALS